MCATRSVVVVLLRGRRRGRVGGGGLRTLLRLGRAGGRRAGGLGRRFVLVEPARGRPRCLRRARRATSRPRGSPARRPARASRRTGLSRLVDRVVDLPLSGRRRRSLSVAFSASDLPQPAPIPRTLPPPASASGWSCLASPARRAPRRRTRPARRRSLQPRRRPRPPPPRDRPRAGGSPCGSGAGIGVAVLASGPGARRSSTAAAARAAPGRPCRRHATLPSCGPATPRRRPPRRRRRRSRAASRTLAWRTPAALGERQHGLGDGQVAHGLGRLAAAERGPGIAARYSSCLVQSGRSRHHGSRPQRPLAVMRHDVAMAYRELPPPPELASLVRCLWIRRADGSPTLVLPDGCVDVVVRDGRATVAGPDTGPVTVALAPGAVVIGVRFRPGAAAAVLGVPADELRDARIALEELWGARGRRGRRARRRRPGWRWRRRWRGGSRTAAPDPRVLAAVRRLALAPGMPVPRVARAVGLGERQLRRRFAEGGRLRARRRSRAWRASAARSRCCARGEPRRPRPRTRRLRRPGAPDARGPARWRGRTPAALRRLTVPSSAMRPARVVRDLPRVAVGVDGRARIAAPERLAARAAARAAGRRRPGEHRVDLRRRAHVVGERQPPQPPRSSATPLSAASFARAQSANTMPPAWKKATSPSGELPSQPSARVEVRRAAAGRRRRA